MLTIHITNHKISKGFLTAQVSLAGIVIWVGNLIKLQIQQYSQQFKADSHLYQQAL